MKTNVRKHVDTIEFIEVIAQLIVKLRAEALKQYEIESRTAVCRTTRTVVWEGDEIILPK